MKLRLGRDGERAGVDELEHVFEAPLGLAQHQGRADVVADDVFRAVQLSSAPVGCSAQRLSPGGQRR